MFPGKKIEKSIKAYWWIEYDIKASENICSENNIVEGSIGFIGIYWKTLVTIFCAFFKF